MCLTFEGKAKIFQSETSYIELIALYVHQKNSNHLYKVPAVHMSKLQRIQNSAARLVCSTPRFNHVTPVLFSLHWLPVAYRIEFKILVLTFKAIYQLAPSYICNLVRLKEKCKYQLRSSENYYCSCPWEKQRKLWVTDHSKQLPLHCGTVCLQVSETSITFCFLNEQL